MYVVLISRITILNIVSTVHSCFKQLVTNISNINGRVVLTRKPKTARFCLTSWSYHWEQIESKKKGIYEFLMWLILTRNLVLHVLEATEYSTHIHSMEF